MELGFKEKKILMVFLGAVLLFVYVFWILLPQIEIKQALEEEIARFKSDFNFNLAYKKKMVSLDSEIKIMNSKLSKIRKIYPPMINYDDLIICIKNLAVNTGVNISDIKFGNYKLFGDKKSNNFYNSEINNITDKDIYNLAKGLGFVVDDANASIDVSKIDIPNGTPYIFTVQFNVKGNNDEIKKFFEAVYKLNNKVVVNNFSLSVNDIGEHSANVEIGFLGIMDRYAGEYSLLDDGTWKLIAPAGKSDFFLPYQGYSNGEASNLELAQELEMDRETSNYNFILSVLPYGKGLTAPTIELSSQGIDNNEAGMSLKRFVNADNPGVENLEIYLEERDGVYYCKYKTQTEAFPEKTYTQLVKINPINDKFGLFVVSSKRSSENDKSGANINVINKTGKNVSVKIKYDDEESPRVKINSIQGGLVYE